VVVTMGGSVEDGRCGHPCHHRLAHDLIAVQGLRVGAGKDPLERQLLQPGTSQIAAWVEDAKE